MLSTEATRSSSPDFATTHPKAAEILSNILPTHTELQACWELCRLQNNIGFWVVWLPTAWSIAMAYHAEPEISALGALQRAAVYVPLCFGIKSLIMTIDDILDSDIDGLVERTRNRAIPRGAISQNRAWLFFFLQVAIGVGIAFTYLSTAALRVSMIVWPLYIIYPTCKRWTNLAPIPLGLMFKVGIFMGWCDVTTNGNIPWSTLLLIYIGACLWTITYETVYQHQDKIDDVKLGLHSPALLCREYTIMLCTVTGVGFLSLLSYGGYLNGHGPLFYLGVICAAILLLPRLIATDVDRPEDCRNLFLGTPLVGQVILGGLVMDAVTHRLRSGIPL
ncbi:4-hydroxybenzoate polyprenyltransferase, mitochondrial [Hypsizygus marmoreus]|uniref:4-hydroxybenzoate polyprenyltransferase, mitochondrial n=1 Tax=Hypsizygus marmoreus TaxID=39966 RepID=A0A369JGR0_HYPMA|nr:4-hydroxybenzoate polyprenyltransferase, mitochondrial [Hypsizygus marmoreus]